MDVEAGWYADPDDASSLRYWDGSTWTEHRVASPGGVEAADGGLSAPAGGDRAEPGGAGLAEESVDRSEPFDRSGNTLDRSEPIGSALLVPGPGSTALPSIPGVEMGSRVDGADSGDGVVTYVGFQPALDRQVTVKVIEGTLSGGARDRFEREQRTLGRLSGHQSIAAIYDSGVTAEGVAYLVMAHHETSLADELESGLPIPIEAAAAMVADAADGVHHAHAHGVIHGGIWPGAIWRAGASGVAVGGFGLADVAHTGSALRAATGAGRAEMMRRCVAPEVVAGGRPTIASDVYALGAVLALATDRSGMRSGTVAAAIAAAMTPDPWQRPDSVAAFVHLLRGTAGGAAMPDAAEAVAAAPPTVLVATPAPPPPSAEPPQEAKRSKLPLVAALVTLLVLLGVAGVLLLGGGDGEVATESLLDAPDDGGDSAADGENPGEDGDGGFGADGADGGEGRAAGPGDGGDEDEGADADDGGDAVVAPPKPTPSPTPEPTPVPVDAAAALDRHDELVYRVRYVGCGGMGVATASPTGDGRLVTSADLSLAGWYVEVESLADGRTGLAVVQGRTTDGLTILDVADISVAPLPSAVVPEVGSDVAVVGLNGAELPAVVGVLDSTGTPGVAPATVTADGIGPRTVGAAVFTGDGEWVGVVGSVSGSTAQVVTQLDLAATPQPQRCDPVAIGPLGPETMVDLDARSFALAQELASALADNDWPRVRQLDTPKADYDDRRFEDGWRGLERSTLIPVRVTVRGRDYRHRMLLVAHEFEGSRQVTKPFCVTWEIDPIGDTAVQTGEDSVSFATIDGWVDPGELHDDAQDQC